MDKLVKHRAKLYWIFWLMPLLLLPFPWIKAEVEDIGILHPINGTGILVLKNFSGLAIWYLILTLGMLLTEFSRKSLKIKVIVFAVQLLFASYFWMLPRFILGPTGLASTGFRNLDFYESTYLLAIHPVFMLACISFILMLLCYYFFNLFPKSKLEN